MAPANAQIADKAALRKGMRAARAGIDAHARIDAANQIAASLVQLAQRLSGPIAGYWPIHDELDLRIGLTDLARRQCLLALPVMVAQDQPLQFRQWAPDDPLDAGPYGTRQPVADAPLITPTTLLVPLLAFDEQGNRLGYGGGYYDRTLAFLRAQGPLTAIGVGFSMQRLDFVPTNAHDQPLDAIVTETGIWSHDRRLFSG